MTDDPNKGKTHDQLIAATKKSVDETKTLVEEVRDALVTDSARVQD